MLKTIKDILMEGETIVSMIEHKGDIIIATTDNVYMIRDSQLRVVKINTNKEEE